MPVSFAHQPLTSSTSTLNEKSATASAPSFQAALANANRSLAASSSTTVSAVQTNESFSLSKYALAQPPAYTPMTDSYAANAFKNLNTTVNTSAVSWLRTMGRGIGGQTIAISSPVGQPLGNGVGSRTMLILNQNGYVNGRRVPYYLTFVYTEERPIGPFTNQITNVNSYFQLSPNLETAKWQYEIFKGALESGADTRMVFNVLSNNYYQPTALKWRQTTRPSYEAT